MQKELKNWFEKGSFFQYNEHKIFFIQEGVGKNLLILHGYPYNSFEWASIWDELTKKYRVVVFDLLGMGFSDKPQDYFFKYQFLYRCKASKK